MARPISIGDVLTRSIGVLRQRPLTYLVIGVVFSILPALLVVLSDYGWAPNIELTLYDMLQGMTEPESVEDLTSLGPRIYVPIFIVGAIKQLLYAVPQVALIGLVARAAVSKPIGSAFAINGLLGWWKLFMVWIVSTVAALSATLFIIIPGVIVFVMLFACLQVAATEKRSVIGSLARSVDLTKGNRWRVFAIFLISFLIVGIPLVAIGFVSALIGSDADMAFQTWQEYEPSVTDYLLDFGFIPALTMAIELWFASLAAQTYIALRDAVDGPGKDVIADTFG